jgi:long-chain fatty acid transport protein
MRSILKRSLTSLAVAALLISPLANATNGYFKIGYGSKNRGMAGTGMAFGQDTLASAVNPATLPDAFKQSDNRIDAGLEIFKPKRKGEVDARGMFVPDLGAGPRQGQLSDEKSRSNTFFIPSFGIGSKWTDNIYFGISAVANGGLNTRYGDNQAANTPGGGNIYTDAFAPVVGDSSSSTFQPGPSGFAGFLEAVNGVPNTVLDPNLANLYLNPNTTPTLGVNLAQVLIAPTLAYKFNQNHTIGFAPVIGYQTFRAYGLGLFQAFSSDPGNVTNNGNDDSYGFGARIGYQGNFGRFSVGASATSKIYMDEFDDYSGLFAEEGDFDIPATFGAGVAFRATPKITIAADVTRIMYSDVDSIANEGPTANQFFSAFTGALVGDPSLISNPLGTNDGWGFGWDDVWVYKIGVNYEHNSEWTFRAGYNYAEVPYDEDQVLFNVLAPAVVEHHVTAGFTYNVNPSSELTVTYMHAFRNDLEYTYEGSGPFTGFSYSAKNDMYQNAIEASYAWKF